MNKMATPFKQFIRDKLNVVYGLFVDIQDFNKDELVSLKKLVEEELSSKNKDED